MHVNSKIWRKLQIDAGAAVEITLLLDVEPREAVIPPNRRRRPGPSPLSTP
jgi:hypothetical protein